MPQSSRIGSIAMVSSHGYFDPVPQLGQTDTGGQVVYVVQLARALAALGIRVDIYTRWFDREREQVDPLPDRPDARVVRIPAGSWEFIPKEKIYHVLPELIGNMADFVRDHGLSYNLIHGHYVDGGIVAVGVARELDLPAFFTAHSLGAWKREQMGGDPEAMDRKYNFTHRISEEKRVFNAVRAQTATTQVQLEKLRDLYGFQGDNVGVIPPGVDVETFRPRGPHEERFDTGLPARYMLCLSRIDANKGHDLLLYAFDIVRRAVPDVHLVIGGGSARPQSTEAEVLAKMRSIIAEKQMEDRVHITGYIPDEALVPTYQQAEMFVLPSLFEPFGMTALEAMACARPVVASRLGGIRNVIVSGESGTLVDPSDAGEFAGAMTALLRDGQLGERIGQKGRQVVLDSFSWDAIARRHAEFYEAYL